MVFFLSQLCDSECVQKIQELPWQGLREGLSLDPGPLGRGREEGLEAGTIRQLAQLLGCGLRPAPPPPCLFEQLCTYRHLDKPWHCLPPL